MYDSGYVLTTTLPLQQIGRLALFMKQVHPITVNTLTPKEFGQHFAEYIFKSISLYRNVCIIIQISHKFVPNAPSYW